MQQPKFHRKIHTSQKILKILRTKIFDFHKKAKT
jgi:hypothetical protein